MQPHVFPALQEVSSHKFGGSNVSLLHQVRVDVWLTSAPLAANNAAPADVHAMLVAFVEHPHLRQMQVMQAGNRRRINVRQVFFIDKDTGFDVQAVRVIDDNVQSEKLARSMTKRKWRLRRLGRADDYDYDVTCTGCMSMRVDRWRRHTDCAIQ